MRLPVFDGSPQWIQDITARGVTAEVWRLGPELHVFVPTAAEDAEPEITHAYSVLRDAVVTGTCPGCGARRITAERGSGMYHAPNSAAHKAVADVMHRR